MQPDSTSEYAKLKRIMKKVSISFIPASHNSRVKQDCIAKKHLCQEVCYNASKTERVKMTIISLDNENK